MSWCVSLSYTGSNSTYLMTANHKLKIFQAVHKLGPQLVNSKLMTAFQFLDAKVVLYGSTDLNVLTQRLCGEDVNIF